MQSSGCIGQGGVTTDLCSSGSRFGCTGNFFDVLLRTGCCFEVDEGGRGGSVWSPTPGCLRLGGCKPATPGTILGRQFVVFPAVWQAAGTLCMLSVLVSACAESTSTYGGCKAPISGIFVRLLYMPETSRTIRSIRGGTCGPTHLLVWPAFGNIDDPEKTKLLGGCGDGSMLLGSGEYPMT